MPWVRLFITEAGHHLPQPVAKWVVWLGRAGFTSRGIFYLGIGLLTLFAAIGVGGADLSRADNIMEVVANLPLGQFLVIATAAGLVAYALWRLVQAVFNLEHLDRSLESTCYRCYYILDGLFHAGWALFVILAIANPGGGNEDETRVWTARLMSQPFGRWLVGIVGAGTIVSGVYLFFRAFSHKFQEDWHERHTGPALKHGMVAVARFGEVARGFVFGMIGVFLVRAAWRFDADEAKGLGESLRLLAMQPFGRWLLGAVAAGFLAYALYSFIDAVYRKFGRGERSESHSSVESERDRSV